MGSFWLFGHCKMLACYLFYTTASSGPRIWLAELLFKSAEFLYLHISLFVLLQLCSWRLKWKQSECAFFFFSIHDRSSKTRSWAKWLQSALDGGGEIDVAPPTHIFSLCVAWQWSKITFFFNIFFFLHYFRWWRRNVRLAIFLRNACHVTLIVFSNKQ